MKYGLFFLSGVRNLIKITLEGGKKHTDLGEQRIGHLAEHAAF